MAADATAAFVALILVSFLPPLFFAVILRNTEKTRREPWQGLAKAFLWGAFGAVLLAVLLETLLFPLIPDSGGLLPLVPPEAVALTIGAVLIAPIVEESAKALGMRWVHDEDPEPEDGAIYGGMMGLGFAGTENAFYVSIAFGLGGVWAAAMTALVRGFATVALHGAASAIAGDGYWRATRGGQRGAFVAALLLAMGLHAAFNALASIAFSAAFGLAILLALATWSSVRRKLRRHDAAAAGLLRLP